MSYFLNLSSDDRKANENTDDFTINFSPPIAIPRNWALALETLSIWYSWYNISSNFNNQTFRYYNGAVWTNITIPAGLYSIEDINSYVQAQMKANGDYTVVGGVDTFYITLTANYNTFKLDITISGGYQIDLTVGTLYQLFGFSSAIVSSSQSGTSNVNITNGVDKILIRVDCVTGGYRGPNASDVIYSFQADGEPSSLLSVKPNRLIFLPLIRSNYLYDLRITVIDQLGRRVNLNSESVNISLVLKRIG
jgi:hypothetical protein